MVGINSLGNLRNINLSSVKEGTKKTAALTLLLSTVACSLNENTIVPFCIVPLVTIVPLAITIGIIVDAISKNSGGGGGSSGNTVGRY